MDQSVILREAFETLNEGGLEGLTLRKLASRLGVKAPALYWHFSSKQALLDAMAMKVLHESVEEAKDLALLKDWREWAMTYYTRLRALLMRYRDGGRMFSGTYLTDPDLYSQMEASLLRVVNAGFTLRQAVVGLSALYSYTIGFVIEEQATELAPGRPNAQYDLTVREQRVNKEKHPLAAAAGAEIFLRQDERFVDGLGLIIEGMTALLG